MRTLLPLLLLTLLSCTSSPTDDDTHPMDDDTTAGDDDATAGDDDDTTTDDDDDVTADDDDTTPPPPCPSDTVHIDDFCIDRFEAPNSEGQLPFVMFTLVEAADWCAARHKRLCFDDEWTRACAGVDETSYPYGDTHQPGVCNDDETWITYNQSLLNGWPSSACSTTVESYEALMDAARAVSGTAAAAADHVEALYQAEPGGSNAGCTNADGAFDLCGNIEEWTRRRDGGEPDFHGNLKGRYWAESRTCQSNLTSHGDYFRFYEIGFRCCVDAG